MTKKKASDIDKFVENYESIQTLPNWIVPFRKSVSQKSRLPFLIMYYADGIMKTLPNKSSAIAISTSQLQKSGDLLEGTNSLSLHGELKELGVLKRLGEKRAKGYLKRFEASK